MNAQNKEPGIVVAGETLRVLELVQFQCTVFLKGEFTGDWGKTVS